MDRRFIENNGVVLGFAPVALSGAALDGDWARLDRHHRAAIILNIGVISATMTVDLQQALTNAGGSEKALTISRAWISAANSDVFAAATITSGGLDIAATDDAKQVVIEIEPNDMDIENDFIWFQLVLGSTTAVVASHYVMRHPKYSGAVGAVLTAI